MEKKKTASGDLRSDKASFLSRLKTISDGRDSDSGPNRQQREWHVSAKGRDSRDGTPGSPLATIQEALDNAGPGDRIVVGQGAFSGAKISKSFISIHGSGERTVIGGMHGDPRVGFEARGGLSGISISHLGFSGTLFPVFASGIERSSFSYLAMDRPFQGITLLSCSGCEIKFNRVSGLRQAPELDEAASGIFMAGSSSHGKDLRGNAVSFNHISDSTELTGPGHEGLYGIGISFGNLDLPGGEQVVFGNEISHNRINVSNRPAGADGARKGIAISVFDDAPLLRPQEKPGRAISSNSIRFNDLRGSGVGISVEDDRIRSGNSISDNA